MKKKRLSLKQLKTEIEVLKEKIGEIDEVITSPVTNQIIVVDEPDEDVSQIQTKVTEPVSPAPQLIREAQAKIVINPSPAMSGVFQYRMRCQGFKFDEEGIPVESTNKKRVQVQANGYKFKFDDHVLKYFYASFADYDLQLGNVLDPIFNSPPEFNQYEKFTVDSLWNWRKIFYYPTIDIAIDRMHKQVGALIGNAGFRKLMFRWYRDKQPYYAMSYGDTFDIITSPWCTDYQLQLIEEQRSNAMKQTEDNVKRSEQTPEYLAWKKAYDEKQRIAAEYARKLDEESGQLNRGKAEAIK